MSAPKMSEATARATLGVKASATQNDLEQAWQKKLVQTPSAFHPEIEQAYEVLRTQAPLPYKLVDSKKPADVELYPKRRALQLIVKIAKTDPDKLILEGGTIRIKDTIMEVSPHDFSKPDTRKTIEDLYNILKERQDTIDVLKLKTVEPEPAPDTTVEEKENAGTKEAFDFAVATACTAFTNSGKQGPYDFRDVLDVQPSAIKETFDMFHHEAKDTIGDLFHDQGMGKPTAVISALVAYGTAPADLTFLPSALLGVATGSMTGLTANILASTVTPAAISVGAIAGALTCNTLGRVFCAASEYIYAKPALVQSGMIGGAALGACLAPDIFPQVILTTSTSLADIGQASTDQLAQFTINATKDGPSQSRLVGGSAITGMICGGLFATVLLFMEFHQVSSNTMKTIMNREATSNSYVWNAGRTVYDFGKNFIQPKL